MHAGQLPQLHSPSTLWNMGTSVIYYFTGTGNSLVLAKIVAERLGADLIPIASVIDQEAIETDANVIGITFPVYYADLPNIVRRFSGKLRMPEGAYVFAVASYGGAAGQSLKSLARALESRGKRLSAGFGVHMPQNAFRKPWEVKRWIYGGARRRAEFVARSVAARRRGVHYSNLPLQLLLTPVEPLFGRMTVPHLEKLSNTPSGSGLALADLIPLADRGFEVSEACTGCSTCAHVCPVGNIEIADRRPVWQHRCENCLACFQWCPTNAIHGGIAASGHRYHHPDVTPQEIAKQSARAI